MPPGEMAWLQRGGGGGAGRNRIQRDMRKRELGVCSGARVSLL